MLGDLGDGESHFVPAKMVHKTTAQHERMVRNPNSGRLEARAAVITTPEFDLDFVHKVELKPELPRISKKLPGMSDAHHQKLCDLAYVGATEAKAYNDRIREKVYHYVDDGTLELVSDPFDARDDDVIEGLTDIEPAEAIESSKPPTVTPKHKTATKKAA